MLTASLCPKHPDNQSPDAPSGFTETDVTAVNTGITLDSPVGNVTPAVGDLILKATRTAGSYNGSFSIFYHGEANP